MQEKQPHPNQPLIKALHQLLRPLVRLLLSRGFTFPQLAEELKSLYVQEAAEACRRSGRAETMSAISLASGIHRKDVKRLTQPVPGEESPPRSASMGSRVLGIWLGDPNYVDEEGEPLALPRSRREGGEPSFEALVASVNRDVRPRSVLEDWLRLGLVELNDDDEVVLKGEAFVPSQADEEMLHYFGRNLREHIAAGVHNLTQPEQPALLDRALFYDALSPDSLQQLRASARKQGMALLRTLNREALALAERDEGLPEAQGRMTLGIYYYECSDEPTQTRPEGE